MADDSLLLTQCNVVVNDLLSFLQNNVHQMDETSLISLTLKSFTSEEFIAAKEVLRSSVSTRLPYKQKKHKVVKHIISILKNTENEDIPVFVSKDFKELPPMETSDEEDTAAFRIKLAGLKQAIQELKESCATMDQLNSIQAKLDHIKMTTHNLENNTYINGKRWGDYINESKNNNNNNSFRSALNKIKKRVRWSSSIPKDKSVDDAEYNNNQSTGKAGTWFCLPKQTVTPAPPGFQSAKVATACATGCNAQLNKFDNEAMKWSLDSDEKNYMNHRDWYSETDGSQEGFKVQLTQMNANTDPSGNDIKEVTISDNTPKKWHPIKCLSCVRLVGCGRPL